MNDKLVGSHTDEEYRKLEKLFSILESKGVELQEAFEGAYGHKKKLDSYQWVPLTGEFMTALHDHAIIAGKANRDYYYERPWNKIAQLEAESAALKEQIASLREALERTRDILAPRGETFCDIAGHLAKEGFEICEKSLEAEGE